jgi:hypothetical protein
MNGAFFFVTYTHITRDGYHYFFPDIIIINNQLAKNYNPDNHEMIIRQFFASSDFFVR